MLVIRLSQDPRIRVGIVFLVVSALGCTSSNELERIQTRLNEIHFELLELRKQGPSKAEVDLLRSELSREMTTLARSQKASQEMLTSLIERIGQLESKVGDTDFRFRELAQKIEAVTQELSALRTAAEIARVPPAPPPPPVLSADLADPQALYDKAYNDYARGAYDLAILDFLEFLESFPETDLADNAVYWIGECYFRQGKLREAIEQFDLVLTRYEGSDRHSSALLRKGFAFLELGQNEEGVVQLQSVVCEYSGTDEARLARQRLQVLGIDADCEEP